MTLQRDNMSAMMQPFSLQDLPRTIPDAMRVCKQMGQRYLWVDRLCIVQDYKEDKYGQIRSLEAIYSRADLVIVAACGDNMQSGTAECGDLDVCHSMDHILQRQPGSQEVTLR